MRSLGLGVGLDTPWGSARGVQEPSCVGSALRGFLEKQGADFEAFFFSFQKRSYGPLRASDYRSAFQAMHEEASRFAKIVNLHHTMLNLGTALPYDREHVIQVTNEAVAGLPIGWVNEDVGIWFLEGKSVPYPLPPMLTHDGLNACVRTVRRTMESLGPKLSIEVPGITDGASFSVGDLDLFEFFAELADRTGARVTLDTGHLLGWEWSQGRRAETMFRHLERFPYDQVVEIHMAGSESRGDSFIDRHHGILLEEQFELLDFLIPRCENLKIVTYEDPKFDLQGNLVAAARPSLEKLKTKINAWNQSWRAA